jgi:nucleoside-diphosphate-sugar epimerase
VTAPDATAPDAGGAFVAGATGYVGREVVRQLGARARAGAGPRPTAHVRPDSPRLAEWRAAFARLGASADATPWDEGAMAAALARLRPGAVFALLGTTRRRGAATGDTYASVDYGLTALLVRAARRAADRTGAPPRLVYLSSLGAGGGSRNAYLAARDRVERELAASGLPWVAARPSFITGPGRDEPRPAERAGALAADALLAPLRLLGARRLADRYRSTTAAELAAALVRLAADPAAAGRVVEGDGLRGR